LVVKITIHKMTKIAFILVNYDAKVGHIVYEPWEYELHANLVKWNEEAKQKGVRDREHKGGNRQF
jgi:hypothetical protein